MLDGPVQVLPSIEVLKDVVTEYVQSKPRVQHTSSIERWMPQIERMVLERGATPKAIFDLLKREK